MLPTVARIFVSSTWIDLQPERHAVEEAINRMSAGKFIGMEYFGSRPETTERGSLDEVDKSDLYVGIFGGRYGSGITEKEYRRARQRNLPCIIYFKSEDAIPAEWRDSDTRLETLKQDLRAHHIITEPFSSPDILANRVTADLHRWFFDKYLSPQLSSDAAGNIITGGEDRPIRLEAGSEYGAVIHRGAAPQIQQRPIPVRPSLRPFRGLLDRADETSAAIASLESLLPVEFCGQSGIGKTALLRRLAYHTPDGKFPDGAVYLGQVGQRPSSDLLQFIFDSFYESDPAFKPREAEMLNLLRDRRALILMDDVEIGRAEVERVLNAAPDSAFLLASEERRLFSEGRVMNLPGLPADEARQLLERELGRSFAPEEREAAQTICSILQGHPLRLAQTAALAQVQNLTLVKIAEQLQSVGAQSGDPGEALIRYSLTSRSDSEKRALGAIAAFGGALMSAQALAEITDVSPIETAIESLLSHKLIEAHEASYRLPASVLRAIENEWDLTSWRERALEYFITHADELQIEPQQRLGQSAAILSLLDWAKRNGRLREATRFGKASEAALILGGQWEAWGQALQQIGQSARAIGDGEIEAWALHQQGTRALCMGNNEAARALLTEALERRIEMGDHTAASVTRHNLDWLLPPVVPPPSQPPVNDEPPVDPVKPVSRRLPGLAKFAITAALLGGAAIGGKLILDNVIPPPAPVIRFNPERLDFGEQRLGVTGEARPVTLTNNDSQPLRISNVAISGLNPSEFRIAEDGCAGATLSPQTNCSISVAYAPQATGTHSAILTISADARRDLPSLPLSGAATAPTIPSPGPNRVAQIALNPGNLDFGSREVNAREERSITLANTGNAPLEISRINATGEHANDFSVVEENCTQAAILPNRNCVIKISFTAKDAGGRRANLAVSSNAGHQNAPLGGTGVPRPPSLPVIEPRSLTFGEWDLGRSAEVKPVKITNPGASTLRIGEVALRGDHRGDFEIVSTDCRGAALTQGRNCYIGVRFTPRASGSRNAEVIIADNTNDGQQIVQISGIGRAVVRLRLNPISLSFSAQAVTTQSEARTVVVFSVGSGALSITNVSLVGPDAGDFAIESQNCSGSSIAPNGNCVIKVRFNPRVARFLEATLVIISSNAPGSPHRVALSGTAVRAPRPTPAILYFTADRYEVETRGKVLLCYGLANADSASINPEIGQVKPIEKDCVNAYPNQKTIYMLTATNSDGQTATKSVTINVVAPKPAITYFEAAPNTVKPGERVDLCYSVFNGASARIEPDVGGVKPSEKNCVQAFPKRTTSYSLTVLGADGQSDSKRADVKVIPPQPPPKILYFNANPTGIYAGQDTKLCYGVTNAISAGIDPDIGEVKPVENDCRIVGPKGTTTYTLTVKGRDGQTDSRQLRVDVKPGPQAPKPQILFFEANPAGIYPGAQSSLCYGVIDVINTHISPVIGEVKSVQKDCLRVAPRQTTTYTITATGYDGQKISNQFTIEVKPRFSIPPRPEPSLPPRILFFTASHKVIAPGKSATLCYGVANASSAYINPGVGDVQPVERNCRAVTLKETTSYILVAKGADGRSVRQTVTVRVENPIK